MTPIGAGARAQPGSFRSRAGTDDTIDFVPKIPREVVEAEEPAADPPDAVMGTRTSAVGDVKVQMHPLDAF